MSFTRRQILSTACTAAFAGTAVFTSAFAAPVPEKSPGPFRFSLNFGTLRGFKMPLEQEIDIAAKAGYDAVEPWVAEIAEYKAKGGNLNDLRKRIIDKGLAVAGSCAFFQWVCSDETARTKGIEQMKREMELIRAVGGNRIAATASGATNERLDDFAVLGERYRTILDIGLQLGVVPQLEVWGAVKTMNCIGDVTAIAVHSGRAEAEFLFDVYHLYRGGSSFEALSLLNAKTMTNFHINDYPAAPPREEAADKDRVYPGDGVAPLKRIFQILRDIGYRGFLSFEVFNPSYWATNDPLLVAATGLKKMKAAAEI
ncbi:MAG: sugar phosphate isomerase/epimerase [Planctomycetaceae bacterium]|jgi:sugar phosphate isomerase/epimerase|nr:sugar phosphate isomerase/epimerase [Planctomycetaceae bacterium]